VRRGDGISLENALKRREIRKRKGKEKEKRIRRKN
jgi:hypothetical protein